MAKKKNNAEIKEKTINNVNSEEVLTESLLVNDENIVENLVLLTEKEIINESNKISNISLIDLISLERACALICKRYETTAKLDMTNNNKFKEYKVYYDNIFYELEQRVINACK